MMCGKPHPLTKLYVASFTCMHFFPQSLSSDLGYDAIAWC